MPQYKIRGHIKSSSTGALWATCSKGEEASALKKGQHSPPGPRDPHLSSKVRRSRCVGKSRQQQSAVGEPEERKTLNEVELAANRYDCCITAC